jgi:hypothetical protein
LKTLNPQWEVSFDPKFGGPATPVMFDKLDSWPDRQEEGIKYYSGTAIYKQTFINVGTKGEIWLDLGQRCQYGPGLCKWY